MASDDARTLVERLGITYPILQAGMSSVAGVELVAAVSNAGGLGVLGAAEHEPEELRADIRRIRTLTDRPFGVDLLIAALTGGLAGTDSTTLPPFAYGDKVRAQVEVLFEERVPVFVSGLGDPSAYVERAHAQGMIVMALVGTVAAAQQVAQGGVDYVIAQGHEAGGHTGRVGTMALVPSIDDAVDVPVLAAGGIADGRGVLAAMALGAVGVWVGTRFVATAESAAHENYKRRILAAGSSDTTVTRAYTGKTVRAIVNDYTRDWDSRPQDLQGFPNQLVASGEYFNGGMRGGNAELGLMPAGQITELITDIPSAGEIVRRMADELEQSFQALAASVAACEGVPVSGI